MAERIYQKDKVFGNVDFANTYISIDNVEWGHDRSITLDYLNKILHLRGADKYLDDKFGNTLYVDPSTLKIEVLKDIYFIPYTNQAQESTVKPLNANSFTTDENYLYVWCESAGRWKRTILSNY